jgi:hypothetical protein
MEKIKVTIGSLLSACNKGCQKKKGDDAWYNTGMN